MKLLATLSVAALATLAATGADAQYSSGDHRGHRRIETRPLPPVVRPVQVQRPRFVLAPRPRHHVWVPTLPFARNLHDTCHQKAWHLRWYERHAAADGYLSGGERAHMVTLRRDLDRTCGGWRWSY